MLHKYESVIIFNPTSKEIAKAEVNKFKNVIKDLGKLIKVDDMGEKRLAYEVKSHKSGYYVIYYFITRPDNIAELERQLRIDDHVLKFITLRVEDEDDLDDFAEPTEEELEEECKSPAEILAEATAAESEQQYSKPDALDVMLGFASYK